MAINTLRFPWVFYQANGQHLWKSLLAVFTVKGWSHILGRGLLSKTSHEGNHLS
jgi:hypothetical protein